MVEKNDGNNRQIHGEKNRAEEPLVIEEGVTFYPFTPDMRLPSSGELNNALNAHLDFINDPDRFSYTFRSNEEKAQYIAHTPGLKRSIEFKGIRGQIGLLADFTSALKALSNEKIFTPMGDVGFEIVTENDKQEIKAVPLTFALMFFPKSREEHELLARHKIETLGETESFYGGFVPPLGRKDHFDQVVNLISLQPMDNNAPGGVLFPFDVEKASRIGVTLKADNWYDNHLKKLEEEEQRRIEKRQKEIAESIPPVVKVLTKKGFQVSEAEHNAVSIFFHLPLEEYLFALGISDTDITIESFTTSRSIDYIIDSINNPPKYIFTDGEVAQSDSMRLIDTKLLNATYVGWISHKKNEQGNSELLYRIETKVKVRNIRSITKKLGLKSLRFKSIMWNQ